MTGKDIHIQELQETLEEARKQRDQYGTAYKAAVKEIKRLEQKCEILVAHNLIHMKQKAELQDCILDLETKDYLKTIDKQHLLGW